jgi:sigma-B regulation protein RsbU (phosphoserine phosphatase)
VTSILIVDDDPNILFLLSEVLSRQNYEITKATDGSEAIQFLEKQSFDLVISDLHMKIVGGIEVLRTVKELHNNTEVLILTGYGTVNSAVKAMKSGAYEYLTKPLNIEELRLKVNQALNHRDMKLQVAEQAQKIKTHQEMLERDLQLATTIQQTLVPPAISNEKISVNVVHRPSIGVGGDFADIYHDDANLIYFTMLDVTGHGIAAALIVNRISSEIQKLVREKRHPNDILFQLNNFVYHAFYRTGMFLTSFCCRIDFSKNELAYSGCAHPPVLFWEKTTHQIFQLDSQNPIIGFQTSVDNSFIQDLRPINPGDRLFMYTDGILEAENDTGEYFGIEGLRRNFQQNTKTAIQEFNQNMLGAMSDFSKKTIRDDIYLLVAELKI